MNSNKVPEGKKVFIKGRKFKAGDVLPAWALLEIPEIPEIKKEEIKVEPEISSKEPEIIETEKKENNNFKYQNRKYKR